MDLRIHRLPVVLEVLNDTVGKGYVTTETLLEKVNSKVGYEFSIGTVRGDLSKLRFHGVQIVSRKGKYDSGWKLDQITEMPESLMSQLTSNRIGILDFTHQTLDDIEAFGSLDSRHIAQMMDVPTSAIQRARAMILDRQIERCKQQKAEELARRVQFSPGCYHEYGYSPENLTGEEREILLEGPKHKWPINE